MSWMFIVIAVIALFLLIYVFYPSIKRIFFSKKTNSTSIDFKNERKKEKQARKLDRKEEKKRNFEEKKDKKLENRKNNIEIIENKIDLFKDDSKETFEDPDTKVNYENFDLDGFFENENRSSDTKQTFESNNNIYSQKFNELFENNFEEFKPNYSPSKNRKLDLFNSNNKFDFQSNAEIADFLSENNVSSWEENEIRQQLENLPNEMKVLILSNFLDRKDS